MLCRADGDPLTTIATPCRADEAAGDNEVAAQMATVAREDTAFSGYPRLWLAVVAGGSSAETLEDRL
jgi:hypothetical protein